MGALFEREGWRPDRVFSSPLRRARDTATLVVGGLSPPVEIETLLELVPDREPEDVLDALDACRVTTGHVLLVGHQPLIGALAAHLLGGPERSMAPATLIRVEFDGPPTSGSGRALLEHRPTA